MPISCRVTRGDFTESIHVAFAVIVDSEAQIIYSTGDPHYLTCIRSSLKPFQAAASVKIGAVDAAGFDEKELALMCASHKGEEIHVDTALSMINKLGLEIDDFECGSQYPSDTDSRHKMIRENELASALHNNCSGKHAGMLALAKYLEAETKGYINEQHLVQKTILEYVAKLSGEPDMSIEIDGCSAPTPFMTLKTIAEIFQSLASCKKPELKRVYDSMVAFPELVGGTNHFDSMFISALDGRGVTKVGGESVRGISLNTEKYGPIGVSIKILDGSFRAMPLAVMKLLEHLELLSEDEKNKLNKFKTKKLTNHNGIQIGHIEAHIDF